MCARVSVSGDEPWAMSPFIRSGGITKTNKHDCGGGSAVVVMAVTVSLVVAVAMARLLGGGGGGAAAFAAARAGAGSSNNHSCLKRCATPSERDGGACCLRQLFHGQGLFRPVGVLLVSEGPEYACFSKHPLHHHQAGPLSSP